MFGKDAADLFAREVPERFPKLEKLFEQAKEDFWNETKAVDWSRPLTLGAEERRALARVGSTLYYGERAALIVSAQLIPMVPDEEARFVLSAQVIEEAKHVSVFRRLLNKLDEIHPCEPWSRRLLTDLVRIGNPVGKLLGMQLIVENVANNLFNVIGDVVKDELVREVLGYVARDEKKHTGLAVLYLPTLLDRVGPVDRALLAARQLYWGVCIERAIWSHRHDADVLGVDLYEAMLRGLRTQDRLLERMGMTRGVFRVRFLEQMTLDLYKRRNERRKLRRQAA